MYLVVGANGFLGSYIIRKILEDTKQNVTAVTRNTKGLADTGRLRWISCDICDYQETDKLVSQMNAMGEFINVIFLAAYHHPDQVEEHPKTAWNTNVTALSYFINTIENVRCFFYASTDSVYGNGDAACHFRESDSLNPVNRYGKQKAAAECIVNTYGYNVVRFPFLIAPSILPHKKHFYDQIAETVSGGRKIEMFSDSLRSSLDFGTAAGILIQLVENYNDQMPKILNVSGDDDLSKYDIGIMIAKKLGVSEELIIPVSAEADTGIFKAKRAKSALMDNSKVKECLGLKEIRMKL